MLSLHETLLSTYVKGWMPGFLSTRLLIYIVATFATTNINRRNTLSACGTFYPIQLYCRFSSKTCLGMPVTVWANASLNGFPLHFILFDAETLHGVCERGVH